MFLTRLSSSRKCAVSAVVRVIVRTGRCLHGENVHGLLLRQPPPPPPRSHAITCLRPTSTSRRQYAGYSFTKNVDDDDYDEVYAGAPASALTTAVIRGSNVDDVEPRRREEVIFRIAKWLDCSYDEASHVLLTTPQLRSSHLETVDAHVDYLNENGVGTELLRENPWLLAETMTTVRPKLRLIIQSLGSDAINSNVVQLLLLKRSVLKKLLEKNDAANVNERVDFLARSLGVSRVEIVAKLASDNRHKYILVMDYKRLVNVMNLLLDESVAPEDIFSDLWVLRHSEQRMRPRLRMCNEAGVKRIKPWVLRCMEASFQTFLERVRTSQQIAGGDKIDNRIRYFAERLGRRDIEYIEERYPVVKTIGVRKMKSSFDILFEHGVTADAITVYPNVLTVKLKKLDSRLKYMTSCGLRCRDVPLHVLSAPTDRYEKTMRRITTEKRDDALNET